MRTAALLFILAAAAHAEQWAIVAGRVVDPSGAVVGAATVSAVSRDTQVQRSVRASVLGEYRFENLPAGDYLFTARAPGFSGADPVALRARPGVPVSRDLVLGLPRVTSQVEVTASATAASADEQAKALDVIDSSELTARADYSVAEAVRTVPGVRVQQLGGPGSLVRIQTRGLRPFDTSVLIDGMRFRDAASPQGEASAYISDLLLVDTGRIEVLRGSGSSLYGTNAEGGVVNIVTSPGGGRFHGDIAADGGGLGLMRGVARAGGSALADRFRYSGGVAHLNMLHGVDGNDRYRNSTAHAAAAYDLTSTIGVTGRIFATDAFAQLNENPYVASGVVLPATGIVPAVPFVNYTPSLDDPDSRRAARFVSSLVAVQQRLAPNAAWRVQYQNLTTNRDNRDGPAGTFFPPAFNNSNFFGGRVDTVQARADVQVGRRQFITAGFEWEREFFDNHATDENPDASLRTDARVRIAQRSRTLFVQDQFRLFADRLQISLSGRTQGFSLDRPQFLGGEPLYVGVLLASPPRAWTGDGSIAYYIPSTATRMRAHAGNGYRAPSLYERFGASFFFGAFSAYGDPRLAPERLISADGGFDQYLFNSKLRVSGTYFYTRLQEVIAYDSSGDITPETDPFGRWGGYANTRGGLARGAELTVEARPVSSLTLHGGYTYTNAADLRSIYAGGELRSVNVSNHMLTANVIERIGKRIEVAFDLLAASDYLFPLYVGFESRAFQFGGPVKGDVAVSYKLPLADTRSVRFFTRVENVFNRTYYEDGFRTPKAWAVAGARFSF